MNDESSVDLLIRAREAYRRVDADPKEWGARAAALVREARSAGDPEALCHALRALAWAQRLRQEHQQAMRTVSELLRVARRFGLRQRLGDGLVTRAVIHQELGRLDAALRDFDRAAELLTDDLELTSQRAVLYANLGRIKEAKELHRRVLQSASAPLAIRTKTANNLALLLAMEGRFDASLQLFDEAGRGARQMGPLAVAMVAEGRAWVTVQAGRITEGVALFEAAEHLWIDAGMPLGELYVEYCDALADLRLVPEALERAERAATLFDPLGIDLMGAEAMLQVARLALLSGDYPKSVDAATSATARFRRQRRLTWAARTELTAVEARLRAERPMPNDMRKAIRSARLLDKRGMTSVAVDGFLTAGRVAQALGLSRQAVEAWTLSFELSRGSSLLVRLKGELAASLAAQARGQAQLVRKYTRSGLDDLARHRAAIASTELKALASGHGEELGRIGLAARVGTQPAINVLGWMERTRAAALSQTDVHESQEVGDDLGELRAVQAELVAARRETGKEPPSLRARLATAEQRIRRATWTAEATGAVPGSALPMPDLRRALGEQVLVEYDVLDGDLIAAVLDARRTKLVRLGPFDRLRSELDSLLFGLRYLAGNPATTAAPPIADVVRAGVGRLRELLLAPLRLADHPGLVVVPVKELHQVPWAALHTRPVALAPSASMWARSSRADPPPNTRVVLAAGPELPGAAHEVSELARHLDGATVLAPPDSTVESVTKALDEASLAHLACHCFVRADNPTFSSLLLSDGYLTVHELDQRADVPHRVILAACESGKDVTYEGNEVLGFVSTLMGKGCAGVIASSVVVPDQDVLPLMRAVHQEVAKGATLAQALHSAQSAADSDDPRSTVAALAFNAFGAA